MNQDVIPKVLSKIFLYYNNFNKRSNVFFVLHWDIDMMIRDEDVVQDGPDGVAPDIEDEPELQPGEDADSGEESQDEEEEAEEAPSQDGE